MATKPAAANTAKKTAATKKAADQPVAEVQFKCTVLAQTDGSLVKLGSMNCGAGAQTVLPESKAKAAEKSGWVKIDGLA